MMTLEEIRNQCTREAVLNSLRASDGNISQASKSLDVSRMTLYRLMQDFGITRDNYSTIDFGAKSFISSSVAEICCENKISEPPAKVEVPRGLVNTIASLLDSDGLVARIELVDVIQSFFPPFVEGEYGISREGAKLFVIKYEDEESDEPSHKKWLSEMLEADPIEL